MRALVISGGGSKGAFAGGVAQYLLEKENNKYDIFIGTSTGSLLISHLALNKIEKIKQIFTSVNQSSIFNRLPFFIKKRNGSFDVSINHFNVLLNLIRGSKTFGESYNLRKLILKSITVQEFEELKSGNKEIVIAVSNLSTNTAEYKALKDFDYIEFCDWIWISCNYLPFMSVVKKDNCDYGDGGFTNLVPIREAIMRGATIIDVIILHTEVNMDKKIISNNPFSLLINLFGTVLEQVKIKDIAIGALASKNKNVTLNLFYTPTHLTDNALFFNKLQMNKWWQEGYDYALNKSTIMSDLK
jgi:predicted patatin/cPLA2 family phospholipase